MKGCGALVVLCPMLASCASTPPDARPAVVAEDDHRREAARHEAEAKRHAAYPAIGERVTTGAGTNGSAVRLGVGTYPHVPRHNVALQGHAKQAAEHVEAAEEIARFDDERCRAIAATGRALCPLMGNLVAVERLDGGARLKFYYPGFTDVFVKHMRCHQAFAAARGRKGVESCPLYLPELTVVEDGDDVIVTTSSAQVDELVDLLERHLPGGPPEREEAL